MVVMARANYAQVEFSSTSVIPSMHMDNQPIANVASSWVALDISKFKANCDVAFKEGDTNNKVALVIQDHTGELVAIGKLVSWSPILDGKETRWNQIVGKPSVLALQKLFLRGRWLQWFWI
ncbi:hypothetical protein RHSIM_Rhsim09G0013800 [Rhododendron simsii]|uniref:Uncharacterized protein n=1 Tax=Rhododendron simsii TaxID=118357 RepID=A0A834LED0_RHOSS|nr:hypothetical protein RHSIM_Rhsim09G0013800 [Rhododendron simsii]